MTQEPDTELYELLKRSVQSVEADNGMCCIIIDRGDGSVDIATKPLQIAG